MMKARMLRRELSRNKAITASLFLFIAMAALLVSLAVSLIVQLFGAMDTLFEDSEAPHFVQMHSGELDQSAIDDFAAANDLVAAQQTVEMLNVQGQNITLGQNGATEAASVMEIAFVTQNTSFDFLLDTSGGVAKVNTGEVGVPVYYMQQNGLQVGDTVNVDCGDTILELNITCFVRDAQMNPSVVTSKRFLLSETNWQTVQSTVGNSEYLIEFRLHDEAQTGTFEQQYAAADLPQSDTAITYSLFQLLAALSDGLVAAVLILIGLLLVLVSLLCLRYTILGALEEDTREIGIMKAVGLSPRDTRGIYIIKYLVLAAVACLCGYVASIPTRGILASNIALYMGTAAKTAAQYLLPLAAVGLIFLLIALIVRLILRRLAQFSAIEALRTGTTRDIPSGKRRLSLRRSRLKRVNLLLALQDMWLHIKSYCLLGFIFMVCTFLAITPLNIHSTVSSPQFVSYMGAGTSDLRIDLQSAEDMPEEYARIAEYLESDRDIEWHAAFVTGVFQALDADGNWVTLKVETGDFSVFPLEYARGSTPQTETEIALSSMNADELGKTVGDTVTLLVQGSEQEMTVCGIYQDVTNGGKTAKALLPIENDNVLWYMLNLDVQDGVSAEQKKAEFAGLFPDAKVLDMEEYLGQTLGGIVGQVQLAAVCAVVVALALGILITAMFFNMMLAKDASQTAILKSLGFTNRDLYSQYILRSLLALLAGIVLGTLAAGVLGQGLAGLLLSTMGASSIQFIVNPFVSYLLVPLLLACGVVFTCLATGRLAGKALPLRQLLTE